MKDKRVTILDVAEKAGVSPTAVSFAFNNPKQVGTETAERIKSIAQELGYAPNPIARAMISRRTGVIGILVPMSISASFTNPFISTFMEGVGKVCDQYSLGALIVSPYEGSLLEASQRAPVDGFIVLGLNENHVEIEPLRRRQIPFVIVDGDAETVSEVNVDDEGGAYEAARYLLWRGHKDILIITFEQPAPTHADNVYYGVGGRRLTGYQRAFTSKGLPFNFNWMVQALTSIEGGCEAFQQAWQNRLRPSAVLAVSDAMAIGVIKAARQLGVRIPDDLEVIGFDDIPMAELVHPSLTTIHQPILEKGSIAAKLLVDALGGDTQHDRVKLSTNLIFRESTYKPPG